MLIEIKHKLAAALGRQPTVDELRTAYYLARPLSEWKRLARLDWWHRLREANLERKEGLS